MQGAQDEAAVPLRASLVVESSELTLADITAALGRAPDTGHDLGSPGALRPQPRGWSSWSVDLAWSAAAHAGTEGLSNALTGMEMDLADRLAGLRRRGCRVALSVVQDLADDSASTGIHLTAAAVEWLATAGAAVDVDQYVR